MIIGVPKEIKKGENRVSITPDGVKELIDCSHKVLVEKDAGLGSGFTNENYRNSGASVINNVDDIYERSDLILKVKEPTAIEVDKFKEGQILFTFLHLSANKDLTKKFLNKKIIGLAYETLQLEGGSLPILVPMSEIAGKLSVQAVANSLEKINGGMGKLIGGIPGVDPAEILIIGGGSAGMSALKVAVGMGAKVTLMEIDYRKICYIDDLYSNRVTTLFFSKHNLEDILKRSDAVICAVLIPGSAAPKIIKKADLAFMKKGSVIVDISIDQGGCCESSRPTTHSNPTYIVDGVVHYCVSNIPGAVPITSTFALTSRVMPYLIKIANMGIRKVLNEDKVIRSSLNLYKGYLTNKEVAESLDLEYTDVSSFINVEVASGIIS